MIDCAATHEGTDRWSSPGPRYNTRADARYRLPGVPITYGKTMKFSTSSRLPKNKESIGVSTFYIPVNLLKPFSLTNRSPFFFMLHSTAWSCLPT